MNNKRNYVTDYDLRSQIRRMLLNNSQTDVGKKLGISQPKLSQYLNGARPHASDRMLARMGYKRTRFYQKQ